MTDSRLRREISRLAILNIIIGGGLCFAVLVAFLFSRITSVPVEDVVWKVGIFLSIASFLFLLIGLIYYRRRVPGIHFASLGALGLGVTLGLGLSLFPVFNATWLSVLVLWIWFATGLLLLLTGLAIRSFRNWGRILQMVYCVLLITLVVYLCFLVLSESGPGLETRLIVILVAIILCVPPIRIFFLLRNPQVKNLFAKDRQSIPEEKPRFLWLGVKLFTVFFLLLFALLPLMALPNLKNALHRGKQKRTIADMRAIGTALESYAVDHRVYPDAASIDELAKALQPKYLITVPRTDGWGHPLEYHHIVLPKTAVEGFVVRSAGRDGKFEHEDPSAYVGGGVEGFERDIVYSTVSGSQHPEGMMGF